MKPEKILKYIIWAGLIGIAFIPLIVNGKYYFPFIVPKTLTFRIIIEVIFLAYLGLAALKKEYRPKFNLVLILFSLYIISVSISSLLAGSFYFSFWSNNERSEGLILLLHLLIYLIILSGFLSRLKDWLIIFEAYFFGSILLSLYGLGQFLHLKWIIASSDADRLAATVGNAGYVAGYLIFNIFFGLILFLFRKNKYLRLYYLSGILLEIFIVLNTLTRGAILSLAFSILVFIGYLVFFRLKNYKLVRNSSLVLLLLGILFIGFVFLNREANWVQENQVLERIVSISPKATTAQNRLLAWQSAYAGFKEKPLLGYGYENYYQVFDKYFKPKIYRRAGSVVWFDRAHNIIFDRLISGGLVGLFLYLAALFLPLIYFWKRFRNWIASQKENAGFFTAGKKNSYLIPVIFTLIILAYFFQNFFIFEAMVTYIPLFLILAFLSQFCPCFGEKFFQSKKPYLVSLTIGAILFLPVLFSVNIKPALANREMIKAMIKFQEGKFQESYNQFISVLEKNTLGNQEYRQHFGELVMTLIDQRAADESFLRQAALRGEQEFDKQIAERPESSRNYMMFMRFLNKTYQFNVERLDQALKLGEKIKELSPTRPQLYYEIAYSHFYLGKYFESLGQREKAEQMFSQSSAEMKKAIDLQDQVIESYLNMITILLAVNQDEKAQSYLDKMDELGLNYHTEESLARLADSAVRAQEYQWTKKFYQELTMLIPEKPEPWINLALSHAFLGENDQAIAAAQKIKEFGGEYARQADLFVQDVLDGKFK